VLLISTKGVRCCGRMSDFRDSRGLDAAKKEIKARDCAENDLQKMVGKIQVSGAWLSEKQLLRRQAIHKRIETVPR